MEISTQSDLELVQEDLRKMNHDIDVAQRRVDKVLATSDVEKEYATDVVQALISELRKTKTTYLVTTCLVNTNKSLMSPISDGSHTILDQSAVGNEMWL